MHQVHVDGHEKLSSQALRLGTVTLPIYAYRDLWGGFVFRLIVLPNVRLASTCAHLFLDFVEEFGGMLPPCCALQLLSTFGSTAVPMTMVSDKGSETVQMIEFQKLLRCGANAMISSLISSLADISNTFRHDAAPEVTEGDFKSWVQVQSKHNTPIEGFWLWLREGEGHNVRDTILNGAAVFDSDDPLHVCVFVRVRLST